MEPLRDSHAPSWHAGPQIDVPAEPPFTNNWQNSRYYNNNNNNNNVIVPIKGPRRGRELHIKQILIQCTYNNTTCFMPDRIRDKVMIYTIHINTTYDNNNPLF